LGYHFHWSRIVPSGWSVSLPVLNKLPNRLDCCRVYRSGCPFWSNLCVVVRPALQRPAISSGSQKLQCQATVAAVWYRSRRRSGLNNCHVLEKEPEHTAPDSTTFECIRIHPAAHVWQICGLSCDQQYSDRRSRRAMTNAIIWQLRQLPDTGVGGGRVVKRQRLGSRTCCPCQSPTTVPILCDRIQGHAITPKGTSGYHICRNVWLRTSQRCGTGAPRSPASRKRLCITRSCTHPDMTWRGGVNSATPDNLAGRAASAR
jgi:hypothetical protein